LREKFGCLEQIKYFFSSAGADLGLGRYCFTHNGKSCVYSWIKLCTDYNNPYSLTLLTGLSSSPAAMAFGSISFKKATALLAGLILHGTQESAILLPVSPH
jgi:hypothetical protein